MLSGTHNSIYSPSSSGQTEESSIIHPSGTVRHPTVPRGTAHTGKTSSLPHERQRNTEASRLKRRSGYRQACKVTSEVGS